MKRSPGNPEDQPVNKDPHNPTTFGPPIIAPGVTDPVALKYAAGIAERKGIPKYTVPVAGGQGPHIPRLDSQADSGLTMANQANMQLAAAEGLPQAPRAGGMFQEAPSQSATVQARPPMSAPPAGILPGDVLPDEARSDPTFHEGQGSMYASAQPALAMKYGVIRGQKHLLPQQFAQAPTGLRKETIEGLKAIQEASQSEDVRLQQASAASSAGAAGRLGNSPTDGPQTESAAARESAVEAVKKLDDFDFNSFREMMMKDIINNEDQRKMIEDRCPALNVDDLIMQGFITQRVPVLPGRFEPTFRSMGGDEDLAIKRIIMNESKGLEISDRYLLDKFSLMAVTIGLFAINGNPLPDHNDGNGDFDEAKFMVKFKKVSKLPFHMLGSLGVNFFWFDIRVRKLFVAERLGNG